MKSSKRFIPTLHFVPAQKTQASFPWEKQTSNYMQFLEGSVSLGDHHVPLKNIAETSLHRTINAEEFIEDMQNISRSLAVGIITMFDGMSDTQSDVVKAAHRVMNDGAHAPIGDHMLVARIATQLNPHLYEVL